jgi:hypothetical protein
MLRGALEERLVNAVETGFPQALVPEVPATRIKRAARYTLKRKCRTSPSLTR